MKVAFHTLGCKVNQYETEAMAKLYRQQGYEVVGERDFADVYVINTCTVTAVADKKSRQYIRRMKKVNPDARVIVTGCYAEISPEEVSKIQGIDEIMTMEQKRNFVSGASPVASTENRTRAYIKVQEGCNRFCSYCVIPYARGPIRSRDLDDIVNEAKALLDAGYKELVLTGINTAQYGMENINLYDGSEIREEIFGIEKVISAINDLEGDFRIRLSSLEPAVVNSEYVKRLFKYDKLCHHLHMSAQSGSDEILKAMNRPYDEQGYYDLVNTLFDFDSCYGISTDIIVGFPGEKEKNFEDSMELVKDCCFCKTHIFKYSRRPMTKAAEMKNQVSPQVKNDRAARLEEAAAKAAVGFFEVNLAAAAEGRTETVLLEEIVTKKQDGIERGFFVGYTGNYIRTYIPCDEGCGKARGVELKANTFVKVKLTGLLADGMTGEIVV